MSTRDPHPAIETIHAWVDGRLEASERRAVERHLEICELCRAERELAQAAKRTVREHLQDPQLPPGLETRIRAALRAASDEAAATGSSPEPVRAARFGVSWMLPAVVSAVVIVGVVAFWPETDPSSATAPVAERAPIGERIVDAVAADFGAVRRGTLDLSRVDSAPEALEAFFAEQGIDFETRVFDLGMMGYRLAGGRVRDLAGRPSALFAYRGEGDVLMLCRMYVGTLEELPPAERALENDGIVFHVYERDGRTLVFWEEGDVVCVLASDAPAQAVIDLSFAKAMKA